MVTEGMKSSEFLLALAVLVISGALAIWGDMTSDGWVELAKFVVPGYAAARGLAKIS